MAKSDFKKIADAVPKPVWNALAYGGIAAGVYWGIYKPIQKDIIDKRSDEAKEFDKNLDELKDKSTRDYTSTPNISPFEVKSIADGQESVMSTQISDESKLLEPLRNLNGKALQAVYAEFGARPYNISLNTNGGDLGRYLGFVKDFELFQWYKNEVFKKDVLSELRQIWQKSGITITF